MFESRNICDLGLLQNARTHGPRGTVKTIEKPILQRTQVHYFCSGNSLQDPFGGTFLPLFFLHQGFRKSLALPHCYCYWIYHIANELRTPDVQNLMSGLEN